MTARVSRAAVVAVCTCFGLLAACTSSTPEPPDVEETPWQSSGTVAVEETDLGLKWNWAQNRTAPFVESVGGGVTFHKTEWCVVQPTPDAPYNWSPIDRAVDRALGIGYTPMLKIRIGSCWASSGGGSQLADRFESNNADPSSLPADPDAYSSYVQDFVERYSARGVHRYAIENEVDAANFWTGPVAGYQELAERAATAVRAADPQAAVYDAGVSSTGLGIAITSSLLEDGREDEALDFYSTYYGRRQSGQISRFPPAADVSALRVVLSSDAAVRAQEAFRIARELARDGTIDVFQLHYYETAELIPTVLQWLRDELPRDFPIEAWETGVAWPGEGYDPEIHAQETARLLAGLLDEGAAPALYLPVAYTPGPGKRQVFRGLIEPDGTDLPAADAYRTVRELVEGDWEPLDIAGLRGIAAEQPDGGTRALVWTDDPTDRWPVNDDQLQLLDVRGDALPDTSALTYSPSVLDTPLSLTELRTVLARSAS